MQKDSILEVTIEKLSNGGDGIARVKVPGQERAVVVFVPYTVEQERVKVRLTEVKTQFCRGEIVEVLSPSPARQKAACAHYFDAKNNRNACGGCNLQHINYSAQLKAKKELLQETLQKIGGFGQLPIEDVLANPQGQWRYRNKIQVPFTAQRGEIVAGFFAPHSHQIVPMQDCNIQSQAMVRFVHFVQEQMKHWRLTPYDKTRAKGWLRHIYLREQLETGKMLAAFVTNGTIFPRQKEWSMLIRKHFPQIVGLHQNINCEQTNVILARQWRSIFGSSFLIEHLKDLGANQQALKLKVSIPSFFQVNTEMARRLYATVKKMAGEKTENKNNLLLDLYCGVGGIALACAENFGSVIGVDEAGSSIQDGRENIRLNRAVNCRFYAQDTKKFLRDFDPGRKDCVVTIDPPRAGCEEQVLTKILNLAPRKIIYVSCDPSTLARDLKILCSPKNQTRYQIKRIVPVDLFAQSAHIETIAELQCN